MSEERDKKSYYYYYKIKIETYFWDALEKCIKFIEKVEKMNINLVDSIITNEHNIVSHDGFMLLIPEGHQKQSNTNELIISFAL